MHGKTEPTIFVVIFSTLQVIILYDPGGLTKRRRGRYQVQYLSLQSLCDGLTKNDKLHQGGKGFKLEVKERETSSALYIHRPGRLTRVQDLFKITSDLNSYHVTPLY